MDNVILVTCLLLPAAIMALSYILLLIQRKYTTNDPHYKLIDMINKKLPQTQCGQCNYPGCRPYAEAIYNNEADINRCPPGGQETIDNLAALLNIPSKSLSEDLPAAPNKPLVAKINEAECIGCLLCIKACPVDAIVGADNFMHTVITDLCTGCELCIPPCPMNCIGMIEQKLPAKFNYQ